MVTTTTTTAAETSFFAFLARGYDSQLNRVRSSPTSGTFAFPTSRRMERGREGREGTEERGKSEAREREALGGGGGGGEREKEEKKRERRWWEIQEEEKKDGGKRRSSARDIWGEGGLLIFVK